MILKTPSLIPFIFSLALPAFAADPAYTAPVGYTTAGGIQTGYTAPTGFLSETLRSGMNLIGLRLHQSTIATGIIASIGSDFAELTCPDRSGSGPATPALIPGTTYVLEITSGAKVGVIQEITRWQALRFTLSDDLAAAGVKPGDHFSLRKVATLNSVFDPRTTTLQKGESPESADTVLIPQGASFGEFRQCFIILLPDGTTGWLDAATGEPVGDLPLVYPDGLIVQCKAPSDVVMTFSGEVKTGPTRSVVKPGLNLVASPFPSGAFLQDLGLADDLQKSDDPSEADRVWIAAGLSGQFNTYFLSAAGHWISTTDGEILAQKTPVGSAILIERIGPQALFCLGDSAK